MADDHPSLIQSAIASWGNVLRLIVLIAGIFLFICITLIVVLNILDSRRVTINSGDTTIKIGNNTIESILVDPRGWVDTGIYIEKGNKVTVNASGTVNLAAGRMISTLKSNFENSFLKGNGIDYDIEHLSEIGKKDNVDLLDFSWIGPKGDSGNVSPIFLKNPGLFEQKQRRFLCKDGNHGALILLISEDGRMPRLDEPLNDSQVVVYDKDPVFFLAMKSGRLFVTVNDEIVIGDKYLTHVFWQDNFGYFSVVVAVDR